jgi:hypothetical protein
MAERFARLVVCPPALASIEIVTFAYPKKIDIMHEIL